MQKMMFNSVGLSVCDSVDVCVYLYAPPKIKLHTLLSMYTIYLWQRDYKLKLGI